MATYWLTPITSRNPVVLGAERIRCTEAEADLLRERLQSVHPRLLMMFKARLLLSDDCDGTAAACGSGSEDYLRMNSGEPIEFAATAPGNVLSHCAEAFFERLPSYDEVHRWLIQAKPWSIDGSRTMELAKCLDCFSRWNRLGHDVILIREDV